jgi:large subunit ribosomal protein L10
MANTLRTKPIAEKKIRVVAQLVNLMRSHRTVMIASVKNLPSSQFQSIRKQLRNEASIIVPKKNIFRKAVDEMKKGALVPLKEHFKEDCIVLISDADPFELSATLGEQRVARRAKAGQIIPDNIVLEPGPTELLPGPAMSDFTSLGIKIAIEGGKITIKESKALLKAGEKITAEIANLLIKLDIKPVAVGLEPISAYDGEEEKIYAHISIDKKSAVKALKEFFIKALSFGIGIAYPSKETIPHLLKKAGIHEIALNSKIELKDQNVQQEEK